MKEILTVAMPMYKDREIAWLPMESLARQQVSNFKWELIVMEEKEECFGEEQVLSYKDRLQKCGCEEIKYFKIDAWIPLSEKWRIMAQEASASSVFFLLQAADDFSYPLRLQETFDVRTKGDWIQTQKCVFLDILTWKTMLFDCQKKRTGTEIAVRTKLAKQLPKEDVAYHVDNWLFKRCKKNNNQEMKICWSDNSSWKYGFHTDGANHISRGRKKCYANPVLPFFKADNLLKDVPKDILKRLKK